MLITAMIAVASMVALCAAFFTFQFFKRCSAIEKSWYITPPNSEPAFSADLARRAGLERSRARNAAAMLAAFVLCVVDMTIAPTFQISIIPYLAGIIATASLLLFVGRAKRHNDRGLDYSYGKLNHC